MQIAREQLMRFLAATGLLVVVLDLSARAATIAVPSDQPTIQAGIDAAVDGDTVLIADGTYTGAGNYNMDFGGKRIVVRSENGPSNCVIDCYRSSGPTLHAFRFHSQEDASAQLVGLTIRNSRGYDSLGDGIYGSVICLNGSSPTIRECRFEHNWSEWIGGALYAEDCALYVIDCTFYDNHAHFGGGIYAINCPLALLKGCSFESNAANHDATVTFGGGELQVTDCEFISNRGEFHSDIEASGTTITVVNSSLTGSNSDWRTHMSFNASDSVVFDRVTILSNSGGLSLGGVARIRNSVFAQNSSGGYYDAPFIAADDLQIEGVTIVGNHAGEGLLIQCSKLRCVGSVIASNEPSGFGNDLMLVQADSMSFECTDIYGNTSGDWTGELASFLGVDGNISKDPLFCSADSSNYYLMDASPCMPESTACGLMGALPVGCGGPVLASHYLEGEISDHVVSHTPVFGWSRTYDFAQNEYQIEVGYDNNWAMAEQWQPGAITTSDSTVGYSGLPLIDGLPYQSRVRIGHDGIWSNWLEMSLRMNTAPSPPMQLALGEAHQNPPQLSVIVGQDNEGDLQRVQMAVIQDDSILVDASTLVPPSPVPMGDTVRWTGSLPLLENGSYIWTARATDGYETTGYWSAWTPFYVNSIEESPSAPMPIAPIGDQIIYSQHPAYVWSHSADPDPMDTVWYDFETANDSLFVFTFDTLGLKDTSFVVPTALEVGRRFGWRVSGRDNHQVSAASNAETFRTYRPGDANASWSVTTADIIQLVNYVFKGEQLPVPQCVAMADAGSTVTATDIIYLVNYVLKGGPEPLAACN